MEKCVLSFPRLASRKSLIALVVLMLTTASVIAQPVFVKNINNTSHSFINANGKVYFASNDSLFTASSAGVVFIKKLNETITTISEVTMGDKFFVITAPTTGQQALWVSTGTAGSTLKAGTFPSITPRQVFQGNLYLAVNDGVHGMELWKLNSANTLSLVKDINPGAGNGISQYSAITISNNQLYFIAIDGTGSDIWRTDGTTAGTVKAVNVPFSNISSLTDVNGTMFFSRDSVDTYDYDRFTQLWKTQGTLATTQLVKDFGGYYQYNSLAGFTSFNGKLYFLHIMETQTDLLVSNGTEAGTQVVTEAASGSESFIYDLITFRDYLLWYSETQGFANAIVKSNGTSAGTSVVHDLNNVFIPPGYDYSFVDLTPAGDRLYFVDHATGANDWPDPGEEYVLYESTPEYVPSTSRSMRERYDFPYNNTRNLTAVTGNDILFTTWDDGAGYYRLWFYDPDAQCAGTGGLTRELWTNVTGNKVSSIPLNTPPVSVETVSSFAGPVNAGNNYGARYSGYLCVPVSGNYKFMIASDDYSELYLSTTSSKNDKKLIAWVYGATKQNEFTKFPSQQSASIYLEQGTKYYVEALHKEGGTYDHLMVAMQYPSGAIENPIAGSHLIPLQSNQLPVVTITEPAGDEIPAHTAVKLAADASDPDGTIEKVQFIITNLTIGLEDTYWADTEAPYETTYTFAEASYRITVKAYDNAGGVSVAHKDVIARGCQATGKILREVWTNVKGQSVVYIPVNSPPSSTNYLSIFEGPTNVGDYYGARIRGYLCVPMDGDYTFYISSDDHSELWLSDGSDPANKQRIAYVQGATSKRQWNKYPSQQSAPISLRRGVRYYVEVLHKENLGYDHISVGWKLPDGVMERPIPGSRLSPFDPTATIAAQSEEESMSMAREDDSDIYVTPNPVTTGMVSVMTPGESFRAAMMDIQLMSMTGEVVYSNRFNCDGQCESVELDLTGRVKPGLYLLKGTDGEKTFTRRLLVK